MDEPGRITSADGGETSCGECGADLGGDANFCPECGSEIEETLAADCRTCGSRFDPDDRFCSQCGAVRNPDDGNAAPGNAGQDGPPDDAEETEEDLESFRSRVQAYLAEDWELEHDYGDSVVLVDRSWGSLAVHAVLLIPTGGFGNLLYAWYSYKKNAERLHLSADENPPEPAPVASIDDGDEAGGLGRVFGGLVLLLLGLVFIISDPIDPGNWVFGLVVLAGALFVFPPTKRRLDRRHPATEFGRVRTTDESIVSAPETPCVVCSRPVENGIRRTFREEVAVAGVPILTIRDGENHYCTACSTVDPDLDTSGLSVGGRESIDRRLEREQGTN